MADEIELISDGDGLAVIGSPDAVERFMSSSGLSFDDRSLSRSATFSIGSSVAQAGSDIAANSGRWLKLTDESAEAVKKFGLMKTDTPGVSHAMIGQPGDIKQWIQIAKSPGSLVTNPAILSGAAGIMAQIAMQQQMSEITDYLARIDEKLDAVLRSQTNQILARMDGVDLAIREALSVRETVGRVSEITWSKVQHQSATVLETQAYALRQLSDLADKIEGTQKVGDLAKAAKEAESEVDKWLTVLARCLQLHDAIAVLELDRVLDASPSELDRHRLGLRSARQNRLELMSASVDHLLTRMNAAVGTANTKVLFHPTGSPAVVESRNHVATQVHGFRELLELESSTESSDARQWTEAASEQWDKTRDTGAQGIRTVKRLGGETLGQAKSFGGKLSGRLGERKNRRRENEEQPDE